jgi:hypothetical protein
MLRGTAAVVPIAAACGDWTITQQNNRAETAQADAVEVSRCDVVKTIERFTTRRIR